MERTDARNAQPDRCTDCSRGPARRRRHSQLQHRPVPATALIWRCLGASRRAERTRGDLAMSNEKVLVLGGNFAGLTAALSVKRELGNDVDVTVVSKSDRFQFNPSFIWIPFGKRTASEVAFPLANTFESHGVEFIHGEATKIDPKSQTVETPRGALDYDYLVIATGYLNDFDVVPGLGPRGHAFSITHLDGAVEAAEGWARFLNDPGA